ncbi:bifunctional proline dehydrogenase/L-glutamate gamma-semialdehyde dehydrogenase PutA [Pseudazoarcus pumilus]|uniref:Bifunctional protein PutA n=1 Tax=Pseudazoarcus pumilus TaxID=2067960 RepID=A0A2I6S4G2_9RHOO|nr:bifunctional proline dehydrogenase/L-glutamate gamma-semialdehyde dehydrogenase PutA [Pseudazoarcus pumilus]AUN94128.1 trifunctional transcriptional regulator/proline dehydrogenase/L-glutamate gamma-semialdehyde dehydrogenase [Pseudazoarcus pumilus]
MPDRSVARLLCIESPPAGTRAAIDGALRPPESEYVAALLAAWAPSPDEVARIAELAPRLAAAQRMRRMRAGGVDALMREFSLSSDEGLALMCLAEALLRVPDAATVDRLIRDRLAAGDWRAHVGHDPSLFVNAAAWGLLAGRRLLAPADEHGLARALHEALARGGEPLLRGAMRGAMRLLGERFVVGRDIGEALRRAARARPCLYSFDMLGEAAMTDADARVYLAAYLAAARAIGEAAGARHCDESDGMSVKLSALSPRYVWSQPERLREELLPRLASVCHVAAEAGIGLAIDAEEADRLEPSLDLFEALLDDPRLAGWDGLGFVVQAYQKRAPALVDRLVELARMRGRRITVRLVKGAYWDTEIKRAQLDGVDDYPVFTRKAHTDLSWLVCARRLLAARAWLRPQFATHNAHSVAAVLAMAGDARDFEFQCLHGMGEALYDGLLAEPDVARTVRVYGPVGSHETLLPYLVRRLLENGANSSFVHGIVDPGVPLDTLLADPAECARAAGGRPHPRIATPPDLYGPTRRNPSGIDLASPGVRASLAARVAAELGRRHVASPLLAVEHAGGPRRTVRNPAALGDVVGEVEECVPDAVPTAVEAALREGREWGAVPATRRAAVLEAAGDVLEADAGRLLPLLVREAGKTWHAAIAELREAVDFCRYYANAARALDMDARPLGAVVCISPWNFPLAIFTGQIAGALAAGNAVLAKPAEQTPLIAFAATRAMHAAGVPRAALQLLPEKGATVGAALVADARIGGVLFTGSTATAGSIRRVLAARDDEPLLICETGGQNALVADSTALPEQLVADVIASAFDSAGQRCSALRLLCVQEDIADRVLEMLRGAVAERVLGDPRDARTDIGPVIDAAARDRIEDWIASVRRRGLDVWRAPLQVPDGGHFVVPTIIAIDDPALLAEEHFGPVLHVLRVPADGIEAAIEQVNALGFGLTFGVHSRIGTSVARFALLARAGNVYVNRNIVGAVVGVQPFGGHGRSGTGPKAGGPLYVPRLARGAGLPALDFARAPQLSQAFTDLLDWIACGSGALASDARGELLVAGRVYAAETLSAGELSLPGPTGEDNRLYFVPVGVVTCVAAHAGALLHQMLAAFAGGNEVRVARDAMSARVLASLPATVVRGAAHGDDVRDCAAVLFDGPDALARQWRERLATLDPAPELLRPRPRYALNRLVRERCVSINTAAAGGNAALFALGGGA